MRILLRFFTVTFLVAALALPVIASTEPGNYEKDAQQAEGTPPMIPHRFTDTANGEYCLGCHRTGVNDAPVTPHPERLSCTGCHGQGVIKETKTPEKGTMKP